MDNNFKPLFKKIEIDENGILHAEIEMPIQDKLKYDAEREWISRYDVQRDLVPALAQYFITTEDGKKLIEEMKNKLLTDWVEVFEKEVLKKALQTLMSEKRDY